MKEIILTLLLFKENDVWLARCLEHNFLSQGNSSEIAIHRMFQTIEAHIYFSNLDLIKPFKKIKKLQKCFCKKLKDIIFIRICLNILPEY